MKENNEENEEIEYSLQNTEDMKRKLKVLAEFGEAIDELGIEIPPTTVIDAEEEK